MLRNASESEVQTLKNPPEPLKKSTLLKTPQDFREFLARNFWAPLKHKSLLESFVELPGARFVVQIRLGNLVENLGVKLWKWS